MEILMLYSCILGGLPILGLLLWWWNELWYVGLNSYDKNGAKLPPGHMGFPYFGEMLSFLFYFKLLRRPDDFINSKRLKYGDGAGLYRSYLFGSPSVIACSPTVNKFILQSEETFALQWPNVDLVGTKSLVAVVGKSHTRLRNFVSNAINRPDALTRIAADVQPRLVAALQSWAQSPNFKAQIQVKRLTFENIGKLFASLEPGPLLDEMDKLFQGVMKGFRAQPSNFPGTACHHATQCRRKLEEIFAREIEKRKNRITNGEKVENDLMDGLMQIKDEHRNQLSDKEVLDNIVSLIIAGYESTALSSVWAIYYLAKYPNVLQKLREENMAICKDKKGDFITAEDVSQLKYTNKVVEETIRMANVSQTIFRLATKDVEYKGYRIPKGWIVILWTRYLHTDPQNFDDPLCFNPDRWDKPAKPGTYQVFGGGARICAGNMLARLQVALLLHHLSLGYKWELVNPNADITYLPHPIPADGVEVLFSKIC
ncbi:ent-kaurenoic acid oxidase 1-like [Euphorbia lathyris]|uniref:ent-kaurenoic acid oxidase 1-like n=1 Tax=Euphorbia lathyris TaxID=212925 RepID=UPI003313ACFF